MKTKHLICVVLSVLTFFSCRQREVSTDSKNNYENSVEIRNMSKDEILYAYQEQDTCYRKYKLCDCRSNFFKKKDNYKLNLSIPVTHDEIELKGVEDISSKSLNAILVHLVGLDDCSPEVTPVKTISINKELKSLGLDINKLKKDDQLIVWIVLDDNSTTMLADVFMKEVERFDSYENAKRVINEVRCDQTFIDDNKPSENGGDVIGGNG